MIGMKESGCKSVNGFHVNRIAYEDTKDFILKKHYAQRMPSISYAFGLFKDNTMVGVLTIGKPASPNLCTGLLGSEHAHRVYELNRLVTEDGLGRNVLSFFVGKVLRMLRNEDIVIVSFADEGVGHHGYIYQATNFIYTGKTKERTDKYMPGNKHPRHYTEEYKHLRKVRTPKHRYVFFTRKSRRLKKQLKYPILPYPKGVNRNYVLGELIRPLIIDTRTGETFYEDVN